MRLFTKKKLISGTAFAIILFIGILVFFLVSINNVSQEIDSN